MTALDDLLSISEVNRRCFLFGPKQLPEHLQVIGPHR